MFKQTHHQSVKTRSAIRIDTCFQSKPFAASREEEGNVSSANMVNETLLCLRYRRKTPWDRAYVELRPEVAFSRYNDYDPTWRVMIRLEGVFGYKPGIESLEFSPERTLNNSATRRS